MSDAADLETSNIPTHVAIIMDGNGRWAEQRGMPRTLGHKAGVQIVRKTIETAQALNIRILTLYAFSTENWKRPPFEVQALMSLLKSYLESELETLCKNNVILRCVGQQERFSKDIQKVLQRAIAETASNTGIILNLALSYGGRSEILRAARILAQRCIDGRLRPDDISEELFSNALYTAGQPDPDLIIRTGGDSRLSNFLLWQASYSEIYITDTLWPDFNRECFVAALRDYQSRQRRFGRTGKQVVPNPQENGN